MDRCAGILKGFWNTFRRKTSGPGVKQEQPDEMDEVQYPEYITGDLPANSLVGLNCANRPDHMPFVSAINGAKQTHDDDQIIIPSKCPAAFEWTMNTGWNAEERLPQRIHLEESKDLQLWQGPLAQRLGDLKIALKDNWSTKQRAKAFNDCMDVNSHELSDKELKLFRWMCIHVTLDGTSTTNPKPNNVFDYFHYPLNDNSDFVLDSIQGTGLIGM